MRESQTSTTASEASWALAEMWFQQCTTSHKKCNDTRKDRGWYPTRLIDLGSPYESHVRLICTSDIRPNGPYVTLSHCWGSTDIIQLTRSSLADFRRRILTSALPKTFADAITVTQKLGVRYLWIDSLCILQDKDNLKDWLHEGSLMHKVYLNSLCNIAATGAADGSKGLFFSRDPRILEPCRVNMSWKGATTMLYHIVDIRFWMSEVSEAPLNQRAWAVQERLLAPRVLHFGNRQLLWECHELDAAEKYPLGLPPVLSKSAYTSFKGLDSEVDGKNLRISAGIDPDPRFNAYQLWSKVVNAYSNGLLTKPDDKMIALSGIAKEMQSVFQDEYVAGLWKRYLPSQLLWRVDKCRQCNGKPSVRPEKYRAPSFSWTSVDGDISAGSCEDRGILIEVLDVKIVLATSDPTSLVKDGFLRIRCSLKAVRLTRNPRAPRYWLMTLKGKLTQENAEEEETREGPLIQLDVDQPEFTKELYCFPVRDRASSGDWLRGLIVEATDKQIGQFRRIGTFCGREDSVVQALLSVQEDKHKLPCEAYDEVNRHTICIV